MGFLSRFWRTRSKSQESQPIETFRVLLSVMRALLGIVTPSLRGVGLKIDGWKIQIVSYFDGDILDEEIEAMQIAETEVSCDFLPPVEIEWQIIRSDWPEKIDGLDRWVYRRREAED